MKKIPTLRFSWLIVLAISSYFFPSFSATDGDSSASNPNLVRLALLRSVPEKWNLEANFDVFLQGVALAADRDADILITPECWLDGYASPAEDSTPKKILEIAQDITTSSYLKRVASKAKEHQMYICFGFTSLENGKAFNAAGLWSSEGKLTGIYHKTHLQAHDLQYAFGQALPVWSTPWGKVGMMICADRRWPETVRTLRLQGARLILNPTYGFFNDLNEAMMRTRSYENQCFIAFTHPNQSLVTNPRGKVIAKESSESEATGPDVLICDVNLSEAREDNHLRDRRPELYRTISEKQ